MITAVKRASDGLLVDWQASPNLPTDSSIRVANAIRAFGGAESDWLLVQVDDTVAATINPRARQFATTVAAGIVQAVTESTPPGINTDKPQIANDSADTATITLDVGDGDYTGAVAWRVIAPDGTQTDADDVAESGIATLELTTTQEGEHTIVASTEAHGVAIVTVEGI